MFHANTISPAMKNFDAPYALSQKSDDKERCTKSSSNRTTKNDVPTTVQPIGNASLHGGKGRRSILTFLRTILHSIASLALYLSLSYAALLYVSNIIDIQTEYLATFCAFAYAQTGCERYARRY